MGSWFYSFSVVFRILDGWGDCVFRDLGWGFFEILMDGEIGVVRIYDGWRDLVFYFLGVI